MSLGSVIFSLPKFDYNNNNSIYKTITSVNILRNCINLSHFIRTAKSYSDHVRRQKIINSLDLDGLYTEEDDRQYQRIFERFLGLKKVHNCFIIHPYVKWGPQKQILTTPQEQLEEAASLIKTLTQWRIAGSVPVPLENLDRKTLFSSGNLEKLSSKIKNDHSVSAIFINKGTLRNEQIKELERCFTVPIFDRYRIVMEILRMHATNKQSKLQVALAEISYIRSRLIETGSKDACKLLLHKREKKLRNALNKLHTQREVTRNRREDLEFPTVAVIGYTNCGKTSLIKALTRDKKLMPRNQLFATLDVTMHAGLLPSTLEVLYVDTVGFISDIPTSLTECFLTTLEDALFATIILYVEDLSSKNRFHQRKHVIETLTNLLVKVNAPEKLNKMIKVGNKCDLLHQTDKDLNMIPVSAKTGQGLDVLLSKVERAVLSESNRRVCTFKVPFGGKEIRWLHKNAIVTKEEQDLTDSQYENATVIITDSKLNKFKRQFS